MLAAVSRPAWAAQDIRDVKPPVAYPLGYGWIVIVIVLVLLGVLAAFFWQRRRKGGPKGPPPVPPKPPHEVAYAALAALEAEHLPVQGRIKEYYIRLSNIVRYYMEGRFCIHAPDMTTEEFLFFLKGSDQLSGRQKNELKAFLNSCDMVKFAKYGPGGDEMRESFDLAKRVVDETREQPPRPEPGPTGPAS